jgi:hypothetical protein
MSHPPQKTLDEVRQAIAWVLKAGQVVPKPHCRRRMAERNVTMQDILYCLRNGDPVGAAEWSDEDTEWKYRVEGADIEQDPLTVVVLFEIRSRMLIVTVF